MTRKYNVANLKPRRRQLRNRSTDSEKVLWAEIRNQKLGHRFVRQYSVEGYIMDFYCPKRRLGIELEGKIHLKTKVYDYYREKYLNAFHIKILKFSNEEVFSNLNKVLETIRQNLPLYLIKERGLGGELEKI